MNKSKIFALLGIFIALVLSLTFTSAYSYDGWDYSPYSRDNYYKETKTIRSKNVNYYDDWDSYGKTTTTKTIRTTTYRYEQPVRYVKYQPAKYKVVYSQPSCYHYECYDDSSWGYKPSYKYYDYGKDSYRKPYYYQPKQDWHSAYYNWNY